MYEPSAVQIPISSIFLLEEEQFSLGRNDLNTSHCTFQEMLAV